MPSKRREPINKDEEKGKERPLYDAARKVLLASVGAVALAQDEIEDFINKLVERGEIADQEGGTLLAEIKERRAKNIHRVEEEISKRLDKALSHLDIPSKADIDHLNSKVTELTQMIEALKKENS